MRRILPFALLLASFAGSAFAAPAVRPDHLWIAWLDGRDLAAAQATAGKVLDRFPDAVLVADASAANALLVAGWRVEGPVAVPAGATITLLRSRDRAARAIDLGAAAFERVGAKLLWTGERDAIAASDGSLDEQAPWLAHARKALNEDWLPAAPAAVPGAEVTQATDFAPGIQAMVDQVNGTTFMDGIRNLAGSRSVLVGGSPVTFTTRSTPTTKCDQAEQYVYERLQAMGFTDVQYDPYTFSTTSARNVVATLPGVERPGRIVILGAHLDSTSPQASTNAPGANDNASGIAGLLTVADILRHYSFRNTIRFVAFTGEEQGLYGSQHYATAAAARGDTIVGAVIFDMIAWKNALHQIDIEGQTPWLPIMNVMNDACARYTGLATQIQLNSWGSDHVPFQNAGYPAFLAIESEYDSYPCYHQTCDTTGWNQPALGVDVCRASLATVAHLAGVREFYLSHTPLPSTTNTAGPYDVLVGISQVAPLVADSLQLHWSVGAGPENVVLLTPTAVAGQYHALIPGQPATCEVNYWITATDASANRAVHPAGAPGIRHHFVVGTRDTLFAEGFETGAAGWTHGGTLDDWQFAAPAGLTEDPATAYSGTKIAGTDITGLGSVLGRYENNCDTWLESPAVNCSTAVGVHLAFARRLAVERSNAAAWDYARIWVNGVKVWESASDVNTNDGAWLPQDLDISAVADGQPAVRVKFTLHSDGTVNYGGWNLDDVRLTGIGTRLTTDAPGGVRPAALELAAARPNPAHGSTLLRFTLPARQAVELSVFDVRGRRVRTLLHETRAAGSWATTWDGRDGGGEAVAPGLYFVRLATPALALSRRVTLLR